MTTIYGKEKALTIEDCKTLITYYIVTIQYPSLPSIVKLHNASFPLASRASQMTSVFPTGNWLPDSSLHVKVGVTPELSFASGMVQTATAVEVYDTTCFVWSSGQEIIVGSSLSV